MNNRFQPNIIFSTGVHVLSLVCFQQYCNRYLGFSSIRVVLLVQVAILFKICGMNHWFLGMIKALSTGFIASPYFLEKFDGVFIHDDGFASVRSNDLNCVVVA